jgi:hypothetical protein
MSVSQIIGTNGTIAFSVMPPEVQSITLTGVRNPLTTSLAAFNPTQLVKHNITGVGTVEAALIQTETLALVPGSLATAIRSDESILLATAKRLEFQDAGEVAVGAGQALTLGGTLVAPDVAVAAAPHANVLGYNTVTGDIEYQAAGGGGGGVTNPMTADLDCDNYKLDAVQELNFNGPGVINSAPGNDMTITGGAGASITLDAGGVGSLIMNSVTPAITMKPDTGFCELGLNALQATLVSGNKDVKMTLDGAANTVALQTASNRGLYIDNAGQLVRLQAAGSTTSLAIDGQLGGSVALSANATAFMTLGGADVAITAGNLNLNGAGLETYTTGGSSGVFLRIRLNNVFYKIPLNFDA